MIVDERDVVRASGFGVLEAVADHLPAALREEMVETVAQHPYQRAVTAYFKGQQAALDAIAREQDGSDFQKAVWAAISRIPYGVTKTYAELAHDAGYPNAFRAVGTTCGRNRLALLVPCHRVVRGDGLPGKYLYGETIKRLLLRDERLGR